MPRNRTIGIGCIGSGFIMADCHLVAYRSAGFNPVAIAARNFEHTKKVAKRHAIPNAYKDIRELLEDPRVEVVDIAVPPDAQFEVIQEVVRSGKQIRGILAQKPLGIDFQQASLIVDYAKRQISDLPSIRTCDTTNRFVA